MKPHEALNQILKDLSLSFGDGLAARIVMKARSDAQAPIIGLDEVQYTEIVRVLCRDLRVIGMLGELTVGEKQSQWEKLVS